MLNVCICLFIIPLLLISLFNISIIKLTNVCQYIQSMFINAFKLKERWSFKGKLVTSDQYYFQSYCRFITFNHICELPMILALSFYRIYIFIVGVIEIFIVIWWLMIFFFQIDNLYLSPATFTSHYYQFDALSFMEPNYSIQVFVLEHELLVLPFVLYQE